MVVEGWLARAACARPEHAALDTPEGSWSYAQLYAAARSAARELAACGAAPRERVAIELPGGLAFAQALHACLLLGAVAVPLDVRAGAAERSAIAAGCAVHVREPLPCGPRATDPRRGRGAGSPVRAAGDRRAHRQARDAHSHDLDAPAIVMHTSGTSSAPRPVELTYGNVLWSALGSAVALGLERGERWLCALPVSHVGGVSILLRSTIYATTAVVHPRFELDRALDALRSAGVTLVSLVATTLARLLDAGLESPRALRCALTGGGPVPHALVQRARSSGVPVSLTYGLTEACSQVTTVPLAELDDAAHSAGPPLFCTRVRIAPDGEILVRGPTVAPRSRGDEGWLRTGDLGRLDEQGRLLVTARKVDTIVSGGENVAPAEVEAVLEAHPAVLEAAVLARPDLQWGEAVGAIVVIAPGAEVGEAQLREHCARGLAPYKVPKRIALTAEPLPRTRSGKLLRRELR